MDQTTLYAIYIAFMAAGALLFAFWSRDPKGVHRSEYAVAIMIPVWSGLAYLAMAFGLGQSEVAGQTTYWARYADWIVSTPLLLLALGLTAMHRLERRDTALLWALVGADVVMIACGLVADLAGDDTARSVFFLCGCVALGVIFYLTWVPLRALAHRQGADLGRVYTTVLTMLSVLWIAYPTIWWLGPSGMGAISQGLESVLFVVVPILSKVGFSAVDLYLLRQLSPTPSHNPAFDDFEPEVART